MRGDPPDALDDLLTVVVSTPHARGSTRESFSSTERGDVYPACAGIHPRCSTLCALTTRLPRMRGDPPQWGYKKNDSVRSTPHARGSTSTTSDLLNSNVVYPACAGIHPTPKTTGFSPPGLPRMRGDPPESMASVSATYMSTPHARGSTPTE